MKTYSAKELCSIYSDKYICVTHLKKNERNIIVSAKVLKVYATLEDCKKNIDEIKFFKSIYKDDFDVIYGDYEDYVAHRSVYEIDAFEAFGGIAFEMLYGKKVIDDILNCLKEEK